MSLAVEDRPSVAIRAARADDQCFVAATLSGQLQRQRRADADAITDRVLDSPQVRVLVATDGRRIMGWLAYAAIPRVRAVLFCYVRREHWRRGVARALCDHAWPAQRGQWVHAGLRGDATEHLLGRFSAIEMALEDLI